MTYARRYILPVSCIGVGFFVVLRDVLGVSVSKYIFLLICVSALVLMKTEHVALFLFFLVPLYAGLPGNYLTIFFLVRLGASFYHERKRREVAVPLAVFALGFIVFLFVQNFIKGYTSVYHYAICMEIGLLFLLSELKLDFSARHALTLYVLGTALVGFAALSVYAEEYSLSAILLGQIRFGDIYGEGGMRMTIDPNFLGFHCLGGIALEAEAIRRDFAKGIMRWETLASALLLIPLMFLGLIGLSRAFFVCLFLLICCELFLCGRTPKGLLDCLCTLGFCAVLGYGVISSRFSSLFQTLLDRFSMSDLRNANGRLELIDRWLGEWLSTAESFLFGVGLFQTNVHFTALQYLFGLGICGAFFAFGFFYFWAKNIGFCLKGERFAPFLTVFVMSCSVPAGASLTAFFPFVAVVMISDPLKYEDTRRRSV